MKSSTISEMYPASNFETVYNTRHPIELIPYHQTNVIYNSTAFNLTIEKIRF